MSNSKPTPRTNGLEEEDKFAELTENSNTKHVEENINQSYKGIVTREDKSLPNGFTKTVKGNLSGPKKRKSVDRPSVEEVAETRKERRQASRESRREARLEKKASKKSRKEEKRKSRLERKSRSNNSR